MKKDSHHRPQEEQADVLFGRARVRHHENLRAAIDIKTRHIVDRQQGARLLLTIAGQADADVYIV